MKAVHFQNTYGLVACGGKSSRMGRDKSLLQYYDKPQRYHVYDMLLPFCEKVFISCTAEQADTIEDGYDCIQDDKAWNNIGPMAALLTAFTKFPGKNMLLIGCDYPFINADELQQFSTCCKDATVSYYNDAGNIYEPLLAWYPCTSYVTLKDMHRAGQFSLQHFLTYIYAGKYYPAVKNSIISVDTAEDHIKVVNMLKP